MKFWGVQRIRRNINKKFWICIWIVRNINNKFWIWIWIKNLLYEWIIVIKYSRIKSFNIRVLRFTILSFLWFFRRCSRCTCIHHSCSSWYCATHSCYRTIPCTIICSTTFIISISFEPRRKRYFTIIVVRLYATIIKLV